MSHGNNVIDNLGVQKQMLYARKANYITRKEINMAAKKKAKKKTAKKKK